MAVVKADAYGHGANTIAALLAPHCPMFAVAIIEEALSLREAGISAPIVVLEGLNQANEVALAAAHNIIPVIHSHYQVDWLLAEDVRPDIWIKVDSGMHRLGFSPQQAIALVKDHSQLITDNTHLISHLACADDLTNPLTASQNAIMQQVATATSLPVSLANSAATLAWPQCRQQVNRLGIALYGGASLSSAPEKQLVVQPVMTLTASIIALHRVEAGQSVGYGQSWTAKEDSTIATIGIGYADGYPRHCAAGTPTIIRGQRAPIIGRVSMDMITVDVSHIYGVDIGDEVELWGTQLSVDEVAEHAGTIGYELMTRVSARVPRELK